MTASTDSAGTWRDCLGAVVGRPVADDFGTPRVDVGPGEWAPTLLLARDELGCAFFDWLTAVDELHDGFRLVCHLAVPPADGEPLRRLLVRTLLAREAPTVASVAHVFAGATWHEREVGEMFGVTFTGPNRRGVASPRLLLPAGFDGHPLRKDFVLASRVAAPWPGAKEPGESDASTSGPGRSGRRRSRPPGVPEPDEWGPRDPGAPPPDDPLAVAEPGRRPRRGRSR